LEESRGDIIKSFRSFFPLIYSPISSRPEYQTYSSRKKIAICRLQDAEVAALRCPVVKFSRSTPEPTMMRICPMRPRSAFHTPLPDPAMIIGMRYERLLAEPWRFSFFSFFFFFLSFPSLFSLCDDNRFTLTPPRMRMIVDAFKDTLELGLEKPKQVVVRFPLLWYCVPQTPIREWGGSGIASNVQSLSYAAIESPSLFPFAGCMTKRVAPGFLPAHARKHTTS